MIIWQGWGILVLVIVVVMPLIMDKLLGGLGLSPGLFNGLTGTVAALVVTAVGLYFRRQPGRIVIDKASGQEIELRRRHTLFWIPMEYWGGIILVLGLVAAYH